MATSRGIRASQGTFSSILFIVAYQLTVFCACSGKVTSVKPLFFDSWKTGNFPLIKLNMLQL